MGLLITRKVGQSVYIGDNIKITIALNQHSKNTLNQVKLFIEAPKEIPIWREEILKKIKLQQQENDHEQSV